MAETWSDNLPEGWASTTLGVLGEYLNGRGFRRTEWSTSGRPIVRIQNLTGSGGTTNYFQGTAEDRHVVLPGDLLVSWAATLGAYIWDGPEAVLNQHIFKVKSRIHPRYHYHLVRHVLAQLTAQAHGSGMVHVTKDVFDGMPVAVPPMPEQERIAGQIDRIERSIATCTSDVARTVAILARLRPAILAAACAGRFTDTWRRANPNVATVADALTRVPARTWRVNPREQPVELELPSLPDTYVVTTVGNAASRLEYGTSRKASTDPAAGIAVLRMGNIQHGQLNMTDLKYLRRTPDVDELLLDEGDVLFNRTNSPEQVGKSAVYHDASIATFASYLLRIRFRRDVAEPDFVNYWLNSAWGRAWAWLAKTDGVSQSNINASKLSLMPLPLPPINEQREAVRRASQLLDLTDQLEQQVRQAGAKLRSSTRSLLAKGCLGALVPTEAALSVRDRRTFEPAEHLVDRLRAVTEGRPGAPR